MSRPNFSKIVVVKTNSVLLSEITNELAAISAVNTLFTAKYLKDLSTRNTALTTLVGNDSQIEQKENTLTLTQLNKEVNHRITDMVVQIETSPALSAERKELILKNCSLVSIGKSASKKVVYMDILNTFIANIGEYNNELITAGLTKAAISSFTDFANLYLATATTQSGSKAYARKLTTEENNELYDVYTKVSDLCRLAQRIFRQQPAKAALFSYNARARAFMSNRKKATTTPPIAEAA